MKLRFGMIAVFFLNRKFGLKQQRIEEHGEEGLVVDGDLAGHGVVLTPKHVSDPLQSIQVQTCGNNFCRLSTLL